MNFLYSASVLLPLGGELMFQARRSPAQRYGDVQPLQFLLNVLHRLQLRIVAAPA